VGREVTCGPRRTERPAMGHSDRVAVESATRSSVCRSCVRKHRKRIYGASTAGLLINPKLPAIGSCFTTNLGRSFFSSLRPCK
jgi:hypothetical protein